MSLALFCPTFNNREMLQRARLSYVLLYGACFPVAFLDLVASGALPLQSKPVVGKKK